MKLPRGVELADPVYDEGANALVYTLRLKRWRMALLVLGILRRGVSVRPR